MAGFYSVDADFTENCLMIADQSSGELLSPFEVAVPQKCLIRQLSGR